MATAPPRVVEAIPFATNDIPSIVTYESRINAAPPNGSVSDDPEELTQFVTMKFANRTDDPFNWTTKALPKQKKTFASDRTAVHLHLQSTQQRTISLAIYGDIGNGDDLCDAAISPLNIRIAVSFAESASTDSRRNIHPAT
jgi:hypothetical protein